jgi:hypothetical protein
VKVASEAEEPKPTVWENGENLPLYIKLRFPHAGQIDMKWAKGLK